MAKFSIKEILNGNEIIVTPSWFWEGNTGDRVFISGFHAPKQEGNSSFAKSKLETLLSDTSFELKDPKFWEAYGKDILVCRIFKNGVDISNYFPEFK